MAILTCPSPSTTNTLSASGFKFSISKLPELSYFCQTLAIPSISLNTASQETPFVNIHLPGEKIEFDSLTIRFMLDEDMANYMGVFNWIKGLGFPTNNTEYTDFLADQSQSLSELTKLYSDGTLSILGTDYNTVRTIKFVDLTPTQLGSLEFDSTVTTINPMIGQATFAYSYYSFV